VHHEGHDSGCEDVVLHVCVPGLGEMLAHASFESRGKNVRPRGAQRH
jgi:hypothetical protein